MADFWPNDVDIEDLATPESILAEAKAKWEAGSHGRVTLQWTRSISSNGFPITLIDVVDLRDQRSFRALSVVQSQSTDYPVRIQFEQSEFPEFLQSEYQQPSLLKRAIIDSMQDKMVRNKWVAETPKSFREKLSDALTDSRVKSLLISFLSSHVDSEDSNRAHESSSNDEQEVS